ncbi:MAG: hypothetical protein ACRDSP_10255 [Pseudonocardiaceae bacterium]
MGGDYLKCTPLTDAEIDTLAVLRLVHGGTVTKVGDSFYHEEHPVLSWLEGPLDEVIETGLVFLGDAHPAYGFRRRATLSDTGLARYRELWTTRFPGDVLFPELTEITVRVGARWKLDSEDHFTWSALRRIHNGRVTKYRDRYLDGGQPVGTLTGATFDVLIEHGLATVADPRPEDCLAPLSLTDTGTARYTELSTTQFPATWGGE